MGAGAWIHEVDRCHCVIYFKKNPNPCTVAHELTHALQHICEVRHMDFLEEREHMAYIMQYAMGRILGWVWNVPARSAKRPAKSYTRKTVRA